MANTVQRVVVERDGHWSSRSIKHRGRVGRRCWARLALVFQGEFQSAGRRGGDVLGPHPCCVWSLYRPSAVDPRQPDGERGRLHGRAGQIRCSKSAGGGRGHRSVLAGSGRSCCPDLAPPRRCCPMVCLRGHGLLRHGHHEPAAQSSPVQCWRRRSVDQ